MTIKLHDRDITPQAADIECVINSLISELPYHVWHRWYATLRDLLLHC